MVPKRVSDPHDRQDIVQEVLVRTLGVRPRLAGDTLAAYAVTVARNLVVAHHARHDLERRNRPRLLDLTEPARPDDPLVSAEEAAAVRAAIAGLPDNERELLGHVTEGLDTATLALATGTTTGGVAARLARARARAGYVLALRHQQLPSPQCRPVLVAVSAADRRRQDVLGIAGHLSSCAACPVVVASLTERRSVLAGLLPLPLIPAPRECSRADGPIRWPAPSGST